MLLLRVIVISIICWIVKCDLLDLYVQHMDETMRTKLYSNKRHSIHPVSRRIKRSSEDEESQLEIYKKIRLEEPEWWKQWIAWKEISYPKDVLDYLNEQEKRISFIKDALDHLNKQEKNLNPDQHQMLSNTMQDSKDPEETMKSTASSIVKDLRNNEPPIVRENQTDVGKFVVEPLEFAGDISAENLEDPEEMENNKESLDFEIISENERINLKPFDDPSFKRIPKLLENPIPKKYFPLTEKSMKNHNIEDKKMRFARSAKEGGNNRGVFNAKAPKFTRYEKLDEDGDVILEWDPSDNEEVTFRVTAKTLGYVGIGFNEKSHMMGADILLAWVDDHTGVVNLLDSHGIEMKAAPVTDTSQDVRVLGGSQNETHTTVTFARKWQTCDPQDHRLTEDTVRVLWALHPTDPELNTAMWHENRRGGKALRLKTAAAHSPPRETRNIRHWDVKLNQFEVVDTDTIYWCKIFKASSLREKHHMIGYTPLVEKANEDLVHHVILYECASTSSILGEHARMSGAPCYSPTMPRVWESCLQPVLAWARGSKGEWMPEHVGIPVAEHGESSYYMLEVHYNNPSMKKVKDSSGVRLYLTPKLRPQEAGILVAGVAVSPLHLVPPKQKEYATAGYCTPHCTNKTFPEDGINIVSVVLHSHLAGRRLSLKHIRRGKELPTIVQDNHFDFDYQQSHTLEKEVKVLRGDELVAECVYGTLNRTKPTLGGYAATQEMCLAFVLHYPRTSLAGCYSVTPVKDLFRTLGVHSFRGMTMDYLEKLFLMNGTDLTLPSTYEQQLAASPFGRPADNIDKALVKEAESALRAMKDHTKESEDVFSRLIIEEPAEFRGRTMAEHMLALPWTEELLARSIENSLYHGRHMTFCRKRDDQLALPTDIQTFPNYTALPEINDTTCTEFRNTSGSSGIFYISVINLVTIIIVSIVMLMRRTRHVVLPVRSWQYIGLLIVSLACLTLGLVSRDREGHSGSLAGPELTHQAPHEVDACPNLHPFAKMPAHLITEPEKITKPINDNEIKVSKSPTSRRISRSLSLDRFKSRIDSQKIEEPTSRNLRAIGRLSRSRTRTSDNESINRFRESRFKRITDARNSFDSATRLSRSQDLSVRATDRRSTVRDFERRVADRTNSRSVRERREFDRIAHRQNRVDRSADRRDSSNLQLRTSDRRSLSMERRGPSEINRQQSRNVLASRRDYRDLTRTRIDYRSEIRERGSRSVERRDAERSSRRENRESLLRAHSENIARGNIDRNNNLNRRNRERSLDTRRALLDRVARNSRRDLVRSNDRRLQSRSMERVNDFDREILNRRVRSVESNIERSNERRLSSERRSLTRSMERNRVEHQRVENRLTDRRSLDRMRSRVSSEDVRRERINRSQRIVSQRDSRAARENSRTIPARSLYDFEDISNRERSERHIRSSRSFDRNSMYRRELAQFRESRDRRSQDSSTERRERMNRVYRSRDERRTVPQQSREQIERRASRRVSENRVLERRSNPDTTRLDSRRSSERKIDENARSREVSRMADRRLDRRAAELRISHRRDLEERSAANSRKSIERRIDDSSRSREGSRMQNRRVERNSDLRNAISMRVMDRRANRSVYENRNLRTSEERSDTRRDRQIRNLEQRRVARSVENRLVESSERDSIRQLRRRSSNLNVKDSSRFASLRSRVVRASHVPEENRERRTLSVERVERIAFNNRFSTKWERNSHDTSIEKMQAKIIPESMNYEVFKYPTTYDFMRQAFVLALCTVYGLSIYNGKKTFGNNMVQQMQRFIVG
ncbi:uncharacterized protein LOC114944249 [Nylanderia fulva]|uniref:uncharacterized protein LOC114944249 n=1 Tax=Nylanderia fulva TaxID=613905 RepID=UPI0010FBA8FD|nr:uncharacterized protein LOC114944249 [Nylanderia fulva]